MTASMTAFARAEQSEGQLIWEIRSVNHRYLDIHLKLPEELRALETECREQIGQRLNRGRIDAQLKQGTAASTNDSYLIDYHAVDSFADTVKQIRLRVPELQPVSISDLLRWPGAVKEQALDSSALSQDALSLLEGTLETLVLNRRREGKRLEQLITNRIESCRALVDSLLDEMPDITTTLKQRWRDRIGELCQELDSVRLSQEIAILLTKGDIQEEIDRLQTHFDEVDRVLSTGKPAGRRLDFLMQELNREANTLGSKSVDQRVTNASVELKVLIDQMREQIQNIE